MFDLLCLAICDAATRDVFRALNPSCELIDNRFCRASVVRRTRHWLKAQSFTIKTGNKMRRALFLAAVAVFAAACATPHQVSISSAGPDLVGSAGYAGAGRQTAQTPTGLTEPPGYAGAKAPLWSFAGTTGLIGDGPAGPRGAGNVALWTTWCDFGFDGREAGLPVSEEEIISEIAIYLVQNPSLEIGIDGSMKTGSSQTARDLSDRRAISVRNALLQAGVPAYKIRMGAFSNPDRRQEDAIQLLMKTRI